MGWPAPAGKRKNAASKSKAARGVRPASGLQIMMSAGFACRPEGSARYLQVMATVPVAVLTDFAVTETGMASDFTLP